MHRQDRALRLVPGSHIPEYERQLRAYCRAAPTASGYDELGWPGWPHVVGRDAAG